MPIIKRYSNRKLYDTEAKRYITLEGLARLIRQGADVRVLDHESGEDITALILAQTIFELEKRLQGGLPGALLTNLIRAGSDTLSQLRGALTPDEPGDQVNAEIERRIQLLVARGDLQPAQADQLLAQLLALGAEPTAREWPADSALARSIKQRGLPTRDDLKRLAERVQTLSAQLDELQPNPVRRPAKRAARKPRK